MEITERIIIEQLKRGNEEAYKYLYRHHYALLCHIAREYVGDDFLAETLVGDVVFHLWEVHETLDIQVSLRSYLVRAVRNHCMDYLSSKKERTAESTEPATIGEVNYEAWVYPYFTAYLKDGKVATWKQTQWVVKDAPVKAIEAYNNR